MKLLPEMPAGMRFAVIDLGLPDKEPEFFEFEDNAVVEADFRNITFKSFNVNAQAVVATKPQYYDFRKRENERIKNRS
jgi:hypothetical protein